MSRLYSCDTDNCDVAMDTPFISVEFWLEDEDGDDMMAETHFCSWVCHAAWAVNMAMTAQE